MPGDYGYGYGISLNATRGAKTMALTNKGKGPDYGVGKKPQQPMRSRVYEGKDKGERGFAVDPNAMKF